MSRNKQSSWDVVGMAHRSLTSQPAAAARDHLESSIEAWEGAGLIVPCRDGDPQATSWWTSEYPYEQEYAASRCEGCPALAACQKFAMTFPHEAGVYGGWSEHDRRKPLHKRSRAQVAS